MPAPLESPPVGGPSPEDVAFARVCLSQRRVTRADVEACLDELRRRTAANELTTLAQVMIRRGHVTAEEYARARERLRAGDAPAPRETGRFRVPDALGPEVPLPDVAARAPRITTSGRYQPEEPGAERTVTMDARFVMALPPEHAAPPPADGAYEVVDEDAPPPVDARIREALGVPEGAAEFQFGSYQVLGLLAAGGMGAVYRARSSENGRLVALKVLLRAGDVSDEQLRKFILEAQTAMALVHPGIITIHDIGVLDDLAYFAMELVEGADLQSHFTRRTLGRRELLELLAAVADAVQHAHDSGVIHRDLKPANVIVRDHDRSPVLTDFGLARTMSDVTQGSARVGTPLFMSPEQIREEEVDGRCDVYALGVMLYLGLTGRTPFVAQDRDALYRAVLAGAPPPPGIDPKLDAVCLRALARDRAARHPSAAALAADLRRVARGEPAAAPPSRHGSAIVALLVALGLAGGALAWLLAR